MLHRPLVLSSHQLVVACCTPLSHYLVAPPSCPLVMPASCCVSCRICRPILLRCPLVLLLLASPLSPCYVKPPSCPLVALAGCCLSRCRPIVLRCPLILPSRRLVVACRVASVAISCCAALSSSSSCRLIVACRVVSLSSRAALSSSHRTGWLLLVTSALSPYCLGPPSLASCALSYCAALSSSCRLCPPSMLNRQPQHTNTTPTTNKLSHCHLTVQMHCLLHNG